MITDELIDHILNKYGELSQEYRELHNLFNNFIFILT